ncbi:coproporphyrinogen dehydrogenase HemZ [uncultured Phascolarctobacterium sp.]|uniref:coproporphyrinogen dehydrogenase HemZ n=1 Tax=uncultured Phascolarctobacterium sp. TaxID=512296 RepID=UPI0025F7CE42|nr:coproporphyrinogen dehydrogenase HemZ [uncultured Phascolarctobacterium sp.]
MNNNQLSFSLRHDLPWEITRPVCDMAAFFDYKPSERGEALLTLTQTASGVTAVLEEARRRVTADAAGGLTSGEAARCVKLAVLQAFGELTGRQPQLPWGILTGVRPGKLAHKLLDEGVSAASLPEFLKRHYLLPEAQGSLLRDIAVRQKALLPDASRLQDAGIYIGVPYCPSRCSYCSFPAGIVPQDEESQQNFVNLIEQDIQNVVQLLSMHSLSLRSLYIGGGTPTSLGEKAFGRLLRAASRLLAGTGVSEFTVEAGRPDCFSPGKLAAMEAAGGNRISVNPQTFHDRTLKLIGRRHTVDDFYRAYDLVRKSAIPVVNMDLIIGLPQESEADIAYSLEQAKGLAPENLTVHTLTLKRSAPLFGSAMTLDAGAASRMVERGRSIAQAMGLAPYYLYRQHYMLGHLANIGYAKPGTESVYNIQMMEERHPVIGIGPASASKAPLADGHHLRKLNMPKNVATYAKSLPELCRKRAALFE